MKNTIYTALCTLLLLAACKKNNSDAPAEPLQAKLGGKQMKISNVQVTPDLQGLNNHTLLSVTVSVDESNTKHFSLLIAYQDVSKGQTIDLANDDGKAYLVYTDSNGDFYGAGDGWTNGSGKMVITTNDQTKRKIEGSFSGVLVNGNNASQTITVTDGHFSVSY
jgi:hypothetical protein